MFKTDFKNYLDTDGNLAIHQVPILKNFNFKGTYIPDLLHVKWGLCPLEKAAESNR